MSMIVAELRKAIVDAIPVTMNCFKDEDGNVRQTAVAVLSALVKHGECKCFFAIASLSHLQLSCVRAFWLPSQALWNV